MMPMQPGGPSGWGGAWQPGQQWGPAPNSAFRKPPAQRRPGAMIGCLLALGLAGVAFVGLIGALVYWVIQLTAPPREAAHAFLGKVRKGDYEAARGSASEAFRKAHPEGTFEEELETSFPEIHRSTDATFQNTTVSGSLGCVAGWLTTPSGDARIFVRLIEEDGKFRVDAIDKHRLQDCEMVTSTN